MQCNVNEIKIQILWQIPTDASSKGLIKCILYIIFAVYARECKGVLGSASSTPQMVHRGEEEIIMHLHFSCICNFNQVPVSVFAFDIAFAQSWLSSEERKCRVCPDDETVTVSVFLDQFLYLHRCPYLCLYLI